MNRALLCAGAVFGAVNMYAQGTGIGVVNLSSIGTAPDNLAYVTEDPQTPYMQGVLAAGAAYNIAFFWREPWAGQNQWLQIGAPIPFLTGTLAGHWLGGSRTITGLSVNGAVVEISANAWETQYGGSYDAVVASGRGHAGQSGVVTVKSRDPFTIFDAPWVADDAEWNGFALTPVPEPSVIGLGLLGVGTLLMLRRRK